VKVLGADKISIEGLTLFARIGCTNEERSFPQQVILTAILELDTTKASNTGI
jgi:dihydroneopterin aldolase